MCKHVQDANKAAAEADKAELVAQAEEMKAELEKIYSCGNVLGCAIDKLIDAQNNLSNGFISGGVPFCEGGAFQDGNSLSSQISSMQDISTELEKRNTEMKFMYGCLRRHISEIQKVIDNPPDTGDCAACIAQKAAAAQRARELAQSGEQMEWYM